MMKRNLIFCAYAFNEKMVPGADINEQSIKKVEGYLKNATVALASAKFYNPDCDIALVTNIELPERFKTIFSKNNIIIYRADFNSFVFDEKYKWGLAFYKLCALKQMLEKNYDNYLLLDTDTYTQSSLDDLWLDCEYDIMLYDINHRYGIKDNRNFHKEVYEFLGESKQFTNYGGEFIAGNRENLNILMNDCLEVYNKLIEDKFKMSFGDEFILRIAAEKNRNIIRNAGGYIFRYWTQNFNLTSTNYKYNAISILHCPAEKTGGLIDLFACIEKKNKILKNEEVWKILHLKKPKLKVRIIELFSVQFRKKVKKILKR